MRVFLDDQPVTLQRQTFAAALEQAKQIAESQGRVIVAAVLDGLTLPDDVLLIPPDEEYPDSELRFASEEPVQLVQRTFAQVAEALDGAREGQASAAHLIQTGRMEEALRTLGATLETWSQLQQAVSGGLTLLGIRMDGVRLADRPLADSVQDLAAQLSELKRALAAQDWPGLSDTLLYDMQAQTEHWKCVLNELADLAGSASHRPS